MASFDQNSHHINISRPQSLSHTMRYSKAFFSLMKHNSNTKTEEMDEKDYKSMFNKTSSTGFIINKNQPKSVKGSSFYNAANSFHSNLFITTKNRSITPFETAKKSKENFSTNTLHNKKNTFLSDKVLLDNFFMPYESKESRNNAIKYKKSEKILHGISIKYLKKAATINDRSPTLTLQTKPIIGPSAPPETFHDYTKNLKIIRKKDSLKGKSFISPVSNRAFKIKTMFTSTKKEDMHLSLKKMIEKRLLKISHDKALHLNKVSKTILIVEDSLLDRCESKSNLKYLYLDLPFFQNQSQDKYKEINSFLLKECAIKFNLNSKVLYLHLKCGTPLNSIFDLPAMEFTVILGPNLSFQGFNKERSMKNYELIKTLSIINSLESNLLAYHKCMGRDQPLANVPLERKIFEKHKGMIKNIIKITQGGSLATSEDENLRFRNYEDYFSNKFSEETLYDSEKYKELSKIENMYEENLKKIKFQSTETLDSSDEEKYTKKRRQSVEIDSKNYNEKTLQIANHLDDLFKKWLGKDYNPTLSDEEDEENEDVNEKLKKTTDFVSANKKKTINKKRLIELLHKSNRELFLQNIPKLMKRTSFTRSEIHTTYILYKVLQELTSQIYKDYGKF